PTRAAGILAAASSSLRASAARSVPAGPAGSDRGGTRRSAGGFAPRRDASALPAREPVRALSRRRDGGGGRSVPGCYPGRLHRLALSAAVLLRAARRAGASVALSRLRRGSLQRAVLRRAPGALVASSHYRSVG